MKAYSTVLYCTPSKRQMNGLSRACHDTHWLQNPTVVQGALDDNEVLFLSLLNASAFSPGSLLFSYSLLLITVEEHVELPIQLHNTTAAQEQYT